MCKYCEGNKWLYEGDVILGVLNDGNLEIHTDSGTSYVNIKYCPKCGKDLSVEYGSITDEEIDSYGKFSEHEKKIIKEQYARYKKGTFPNPICALY